MNSYRRSQKSPVK